MVVAVDPGRVRARNPDHLVHLALVDGMKSGRRLTPDQPAARRGVDWARAAAGRTGPERGKRNPDRRPGGKGLEFLARVGYVAEGVIYTLVGTLAVLAVLGPGGRATGTRGAISTLAGEPFGQLMLALMGFGLGGFVVWRFVQCVADADRKGRSFTGLAARAGSALSGLAYAGLAVYAVSLLLPVVGIGRGSPAERIAWLMSIPGGIWLVAAIGAGFVMLGVVHVRVAYRRIYEEDWETQALSAAQQHWAGRLARIGLCSRALVFVIVGVFLITAAIQTEPDKAKGLGGALRAVAEQPYGPWLLAGIGLGLLCYGLYCFVNARFRYISR